MTTPVHRIFAEFTESTSSLMSGGEISLSIALENNHAKVLLLSAASYFEYELCKVVREFVAEATVGHELIISLVNTKAISRQYHTWFSWDSGNANQFFGLFGEAFKTSTKIKVASDAEIGRSVKSFLKIGSTRNQLVHNDYATFTLDMTSQEIIELFELGNNFIDFVRQELSIYRGVVA